MTMATPTENRLVPAAEHVRAVAAQHAASADSGGALSNAVTEALLEAGFARHFVAAGRGGHEGTVEELTHAVVGVGEGCAATAWCASLAAYSARIAAFLPEEGHDALWGAGPDVAVSTALVPGGSGVPVPGGWRLSGSWSYVTGVDFADWVLVCAPVPTEEHPPELRFFALPRGVWTVRRTWDCVGLRATGSHTVAAGDVLVPAHLSFARADLLTGRNATSSVATHTLPFRMLSGLAFAAPAVGAARGALHAFTDATAGRPRTPVHESALTRAAARTESALQLVLANARAADEGTGSPDVQARGERNAAGAAELTAEAVGILLRAAGTRGLSAAQPLQRFWRDVTAATSHTALRYETSAAASFTAAFAGAAAPAAR